MAPSFQFYKELLTGFQWPHAFFETLPDQLRSMPAIDYNSVVLDQRSPGNDILKAFSESYVAMMAQMIDVFLKIDPERGQKLKEIRESVLTQELAKGVLTSPIPRVIVGRRKG